MTDLTDTSDVPIHVDYPRLLDERCRGKQDLAARLLRNLLEDSGPRWLIEAQEVVNDGDMKEAARVGHSIKGSCTILYAHTMVRAGKRLEKAGNEGSVPAMHDALAELKEAFDETSAWLRQHSHLL